MIDEVIVSILVEASKCRDQVKGDQESLGRSESWLQVIQARPGEGCPSPCPLMESERAATAEIVRKDGSLVMEGN